MLVSRCKQPTRCNISFVYSSF